VQTCAGKNLLDRMVTKEHIFARAGGPYSLRSAERVSGRAHGRRARGREFTGPNGKFYSTRRRDDGHRSDGRRDDGHRSDGDFLELHESLIRCMTS
jgi:hypothetical protein